MGTYVPMNALSFFSNWSLTLDFENRDGVVSCIVQKVLIMFFKETRVFYVLVTDHWFFKCILFLKLRLILVNIDFYLT